MSGRILLVGGYTADAGGRAEGITMFEVSAGGGLASRGMVARSASPTFLASRGSSVWATNEVAGTLESWRWSGEVLELQNSVPVGGSRPNHLAVVGSQLVVSGWGDGVVSVHNVDERGVAGPVAASFAPRVSSRPPHAHGAWQLGEQLVTIDLGTDDVHVHERRDGRWTRVRTVGLPLGTGPRHMVTHPSGTHLIDTESSNQVLVLDQRFEVIASAEIPRDERGAPSELSLSPDGRTLVVAVRDSNRLVVFDVDHDGRAVRHRVSVPSGGATPRHFARTGSSLYVANQDTDSLTAFDIVDGVPVPRDEVAAPSANFVLAI